MRVALTGGIGSGKSEVARILEDLGAYIIDTDALAREAVAPNSDGLMEITRTWPQVIRNNTLDRAALAEIAGAGVISETIVASARTMPAHRWSTPRAPRRLEVINNIFLESTSGLTLVASAP